MRGAPGYDTLKIKFNLGLQIRTNKGPFFSYKYSSSHWGRGLGFPFLIYFSLNLWSLTLTSEEHPSLAAHSLSCRLSWINVRQQIGCRQNVRPQIDRLQNGCLQNQSKTCCAPRNNCASTHLIICAQSNLLKDKEDNTKSLRKKTEKKQIEANT